MHKAPIDLWTAICRGTAGRCPKCGKGKLFSSYLKIVDLCNHCGEKLGHIRADDGPPWLTVLIVGHIMLPIIFSVGPHSKWPLWLSYSVWLTISVLLMVIILPRAKGIFTGIIWRNMKSDIYKNQA